MSFCGSRYSREVEARSTVSEGPDSAGLGFGDCLRYRGRAGPGMSFGCVGGRDMLSNSFN